MSVYITYQTRPRQAVTGHTMREVVGERLPALKGATARWRQACEHLFSAICLPTSEFPKLSLDKTRRRSGSRTTTSSRLQQPRLD